MLMKHYCSNLDDFVYSRCGEHIYEEGDVFVVMWSPQVYDDDTFEFIQLAGMQKFQLVEFENEAKFYSLWSVKTTMGGGA